MRLLARHPWLFAAALLLLAEALAGPWGDFPLNDDWMFARAALAFARTGRLVIDGPAQPSLVGQLIVAWPVVALFGFSHLALRCLTLALGLLVLFLLDRLLARAAASLLARAAVTCTVALSPLFFYSANTFMTEIYGLAGALCVALLWFRSRRADGPILSLPAALAVAVLSAACFWTRQTSVMVLPALVLSALPLRRERLLASLPALGLGSALCALLCYAYFPWVRASGNDHPQLHDAMSHALELAPRVLGTHALFGLVYLSLFLAPLLLLHRLPEARARRFLALALLACAACGAALVARAAGDASSAQTAFVHRSFPYLGNILFDAGLGPITLADIFVKSLPLPAFWSPRAWQAVEGCALLLVLLWAALAVRRPWPEVARFGALFALLSFLAASQASGLKFFDRYHLPGVAGLALTLGALLPALPPPRLRLALAALAFSLLAVFSVAGLHDHFRWNEARWRLIARAQALGADPSTIEGGYEFDGWNKYDDELHHRAPKGCLGGRCFCALRSYWWCQDDSYRIGLYLFSDHELVASELPHTWLSPFPKLLLSRRKLR